ncbi:bile acid:sodium symporter family protein [Litoribacter alkaliphilus]|uniref:Bile acid:sodium symporter family protein n=1 Tax=Litoribacter ruber TaxID=702568 RepID=A0AAP2G1U3_9BACT|nr:bile acid:sodium symporter family protein [Litoribacter alkaliphilus]MBS9524737.1 bile acid:sodium symporter family protein [Litoribacter alkaliphilus]
MVYFSDKSPTILMEQNIVTDLLLPLALAVVMLGMGLNLVPADFKRIFRNPKPISIGLLNQLLLLPLMAFLLLLLFSLKFELAVGVMLLAACPGGPTSNLCTHLAKGDIALSVSLTAITTVVSMFTIPLIVNFSILHFMPEGEAVTLPMAGTIIKLLIIAIIPIVLGMVIRNFALSWARMADRPVKFMSAVFLVVIIGGAIVKEREHLVEYFILAGPVTLSLNIMTLLMGYLTSKLFSLNVRQRITVSIESGIQNGTLAITIAASMLQNTAMTIPPAIYSLLMFFSAGVVIALAIRKKEMITQAAA